MAELPNEQPIDEPNQVPSAQSSLHDLEQISQLQESVKEQSILLAKLSEQTRQEIYEQRGRYHAQLLQSYKSLGDELRDVFENIAVRLADQNEDRICLSNRHNPPKEAASTQTRPEDNDGSRETELPIYLKALIQIAVLIFGIFTVLSWTAATVANSDSKTSNLLALASLCTALGTQNITTTTNVHKLCDSIFIDAGPRLMAAADSLVPHHRPSSSPSQPGRPPSNSDHGLSPHQTIGLGVGLGVGFSVLSGTFLSWWAAQRKKRISRTRQRRTGPVGTSMPNDDDSWYR